MWFPNLTSYSVCAKQTTRFLSRPEQVIYPVLTSLPERLLLRKEGHMYLFATLIGIFRVGIVLLLQRKPSGSSGRDHLEKGNEYFLLKTVSREIGQLNMMLTQLLVTV